MTSRRDFLKACAAAGVFVPALGLGRLAFAAEGAPAPLLVVVFQRGGCDGLHLVGPANDRSYVDARSSELRVLDGGERPGLALANGLGAELDFRLHPEAKALFELYVRRPWGPKAARLLRHLQRIKERSDERPSRNRGIGH